jgi:hypothetical protein
MLTKLFFLLKYIKNEYELLKLTRHYSVFIKDINSNHLYKILKTEYLESDEEPYF